MAIRICNFGSLNIDHVYSVESFVRPGESLLCNRYKRFAGGKGLNQSIACAKAGAVTYHAGAIGTDGIFLKEELSRAGVETRFIKSLEQPSGHAMIQVNKQGENCIIYHPGANSCIKEEDIKTVLSHFQAGDILLLQNETNVLPDIIPKARKRGMRIILNPAPFTKDVQKLPMEDIAFLVINEMEGQLLSGYENPEEVVHGLCEKYPNTGIILTMGPRGVRYGRGNKEHFQSAFPVDPVDTTAAGDTFTGFFCAAVSGKRPIQQAIRNACKAAAICVTRHGAAPSIPTQKEVDAHAN